MREEEFLFLIEEIGISLKLSQNAIALILEYYMLLTSSPTNRFKSVIVIGACIFLVSKSREENKKIRDIINMCFVVTKIYQHANQLKEEAEKQALIEAGGDSEYESSGEINYLKLAFLEIMPREQIAETFSPNFTLENYQQIKSEILQCEQHLLRLINYKLLTSKMSFSEILLNYLHIFDFNSSICQFVLNLSNDTQYVQISNFSETEMAKACIYLALDLLKEGNSANVETIDVQFFDLDWWKDFMLIESKKLQEFSILMLTYYNEIE